MEETGRETVTLHRITITQASEKWSFAQNATFWSVLPLSAYDGCSGTDDGGRVYLLPEGYCTERAPMEGHPECEMLAIFAPSSELMTIGDDIPPYDGKSILPALFTQNGIGDGLVEVEVLYPAGKRVHLE